MRLLLLLSFFIFSSSIYAQNCAGPMNPRAFQVQLQQLHGNPTDDSRLRAATQTILPFCLNSSQVYQVCRAFADDHFRLEFALAAYENVVDPDNFYDVYDALDRKSSAFRLHDMLSGNINYDVVVVEQVPIPEPPMPVCEVSASEMSEIKDLVKSASFKDSMEKQAKMMVKSKQCFRADQIVDLLSVFSFDDSKLAVAKFAFDYCIDRQNYYRVVNAFTFKGAQDDLMKFITERN
jgi:hypothetical protein